MQWNEKALEEINKVPGFVRKMAIKAVESDVKKTGRSEVTSDDVCKARERYIKFAEKTPEDKNKIHIAVVRCEIVSEVCPGIACFKAFNSRQQHFAEYGDNAEMVGYFTCGGCSGRRVSRLVDTLIKYDLDVVHLSSCMLLDGDYPKCPYVQQIKRNIEKKGIRVVEGTHH